ncbi:MAG: STAS domain-containing protein [Candidatus Scalindua sp.]|nr:STAS domain-containing protein [Candidatus Scalindua sp.]
MKDKFNVEVLRDSENVRTVFTGRLDSINATKVQKTFEALIDEGDRIIIADFTKVSYISSAGIRAFLFIQKQLRPVSGEIIIYNPPKFVNDIISISGLDHIFTIVSEDQALPGETDAQANRTKSVFEGISFEYRKVSDETGTLSHFGSVEKLNNSTYTSEDVIGTKSSEIQNGVGIATAGENYSEYSQLFGEAIVVDGNFYFYPTVSNPVVDFILKKHEGSENKLKFLNGFSFSGPWRYIISFEDRNAFIELPRLKKALFNFAKGDLLGIVFLIESKGYWGMSLKKPPVIENRCPDGGSIFDPDVFPDWFDYPVEAGESNHIIVGTGILARNADTIDVKLKSVFPEKGDMHIHAGIFEKGHISRKAEDFEKELDRFLNGYGPNAIYHILSKTRLKSGLMGIIELES